jgi:transposase
MTAAEAAGVLGISVRQVRRLLAGYRQEGVAALAHGNRGQQPAHTLDAAIRERVVVLAQTTYAGCNQHHLTDLLAERDGISLSRSTVRRILLGAGIHAPRTHRVPEHRQRRERFAKEGMLVQVDGSPHAWLEDRGPRLCLLVAIDDATNRILAACFRTQEDAQGYFLLLWQLLTTYGRPVALYHDRHSIFIPPSAQKATLDDDLAGRSPTTQVQRALATLGIRSVAAHSPQAKGRIERCFGTLQDRLVSELRLAGISSMDEANAFLPRFLPRYNQSFVVCAREPGTSFQPLDPACDLAGILCFRYERTVAADNTVKLGEHRLQLAPGPGRMSYAKTRVEIQERLDGSLVVLYQGRQLASAPAPAEAPLLRARATGQRGATADVAAAGVGKWAAPPSPDGADPQRRPLVHAPRPDHPWKQRPYKSMSNRRGT